MKIRGLFSIRLRTHTRQRCSAGITLQMAERTDAIDPKTRRRYDATIRARPPKFPPSSFFFRDADDECRAARRDHEVLENRLGVEQQTIAAVDVGCESS